MPNDVLPQGGDLAQLLQTGAVPQQSTPQALAEMLMAQATPTHQVVDAHTGNVMGSYSSLKRAWNAANKLDLDYGAVRYTVKPIPIKIGPAG